MSTEPEPRPIDADLQARSDRYELALRRIMGVGCEHIHRGLAGTCLSYGRTIDAKYADERACEPCHAWTALYPQKGTE